MRQHRGPHPADQNLFGNEQLPRLRNAVADLSWLLTRGYAAKAAVKLVGDKNSLTERQRLALGDPDAISIGDFHLPHLVCFAMAGEPRGTYERMLELLEPFRPHRGQRSLHYMGHLKMMAAAQPFLSGAISKTVNMPQHATAEEIMQTYTEGWRMGLKAIAIYRDGSKRSQPVQSRKTSDMGTAQVEAEVSEKEQLEARVVELERELELLRQRVGQPVRHRMPETRVALNHKFEIAGHEGYLTVGLYENGQPGEIFITMAKEGSTIGGLMDTIATLTSIALQYGVPLESLVKKFAYQRFAEVEIARLEELRLACLEQRIELDLSAARHAALVSELEALVREHPLRERLRAQLMLALYRAGRQAEALEAYRLLASVEGVFVEPASASSVAARPTSASSSPGRSSRRTSLATPRSYASARDRSAAR